MMLAQIVPPIAIPGIVLFVLITLLLFAIESGRSRNTKRTKHLIMQHARTHAAKRVSVIIELNRRADTLLPLLDHLSAHNYRKLEVIVIVKQTAGRNAKSALASYRRKQPRMKLRIITHHKGLTAELCAKKYASGELILRLEPSDRLGSEFFSFASFHFIDSDLSVLVPQSSPRLDQTITSAFSASASLLGDGWETINRRAVPVIASPQLPRRVVTRKRWLSGSKSNSMATQIYSSMLFITTSSRPTGQLFGDLPRKRIAANWRFRIMAAVSLLASGLLLVYTAILSSPLFALGVCLLGYCALLIALIVGSRNYSLWAKLNLVLLAPFSLYGFVLLLTRKIWKQKHVSVRLFQHVVSTATK